LVRKRRAGYSEVERVIGYVCGSGHVINAVAKLLTMSETEASLTTAAEAFLLFVVFMKGSFPGRA